MPDPGPTIEKIDRLLEREGATQDKRNRIIETIRIIVYMVLCLIIATALLNTVARM